MVPIFDHLHLQMLERVLYIWAIRHPGSGYVQGMNGLITPFIVVFLDEFLDCDFAECDASTVPQPLLDDVEADCFWCLSKLLDGIQDNYTSMQPGITQKLQVLDKIIERIESKSLILLFLVCPFLRCVSAHTYIAQ